MAKGKKTRHRQSGKHKQPDSADDDSLAFLKEITRVPLNQLLEADLSELPESDAIDKLSLIVNTWRKDESKAGLIKEAAEMLAPFVEEGEKLCLWNGADLVNYPDDKALRNAARLHFTENEQTLRPEWDKIFLLHILRSALVSLLRVSKRSRIGEPDAVEVCRRQLLWQEMSLAWKGSEIDERNAEEEHEIGQSGFEEELNVIADAEVQDSPYTVGLVVYACSLAVSGKHDPIADQFLSVASRVVYMPDLLWVKAQRSRVLRRLGRDSEADIIEKQILGVLKRNHALLHPTLLKQIFALPKGSSDILLEKLAAKNVFENAANPSASALFHSAEVCYNQDCPTRDRNIRGKLMRCGKCLQATFCSRECQRMTAERHKDVCERISSDPEYYRCRRELNKWVFYVNSVLSKVIASALDLFTDKARAFSHCLLITVKWRPDLPEGHERFEILAAGPILLEDLMRQSWVEQDHLKAKTDRSQLRPDELPAFAVIKVKNEEEAFGAVNLNLTWDDLEKRTLDSNWRDTLRKKPDVVYDYV